MSTAPKDIAYTDTKNHVYWGLILGGIVTALGSFSFTKDVHIGVGSALVAAGFWMFFTAYFHSQNGKKAIMTLKRDGIMLPDKIFVPYTDIEDIWAGDPFPMNPMGRLNIVFHLNKDAKIKQTGRSLKLSMDSFFSRSYAGCNISMIGKKKTAMLMVPGLRPLDGSKQTEEQIIDEIYARIEAAQEA
jgi:hypothetical protein